MALDGAFRKAFGAPAGDSAMMADLYRQQTEDKNRAAQNQINEHEFTQNKLAAQRRAADMQIGLMGDMNNPRTTNGIDSQTSNGGGGGLSGSSSGARLGMQIGGGT